MKYKIVAHTFNGIRIEPEVEILVLLDSKDTLLPQGIYQEIQNKISKKFGIEMLPFEVVSQDLKNLLSKQIHIDYSFLIEIIYSLVEDTYHKYYNKQPTNQTLIRALQFYDEKKLEEASTLLQEIEIDKLNKFDSDMYILLKFKLLKEKKEDDFENVKKGLASNPQKIKQAYFEYIKFLEDARDENKPQKLIKEFELHYPLELLTHDELAFFYYLKGRSNYARGEFLLALKFLSLAKTYANKEDERLHASIFNTVTNTFTDNLFFNEAEQLAKKALKIRDKLKLPEKDETISLLGGIYFKSSNFQKAYKRYKEILIINGRGYNYLAKSALMLGYVNKASEYIKQSEEFEDKKGFLALMKLVYFYTKKEYQSQFEFFKQTIMLPVNHSNNGYDKFVLGWGYTLMAKSSFEEQEFTDGIEYLFKAISYFLEDKYVLEAYYVTLYVYQYSVPQSFLDYFDGLIQEYNVQDRFNTYVQKHKDIAKEYSKVFDIKIDNKNNLENFYNDTKDINQDNYNPKLVKKLLQNFTLI